MSAWRVAGIRFISLLGRLKMCLKFPPPVWGIFLLEIGLFSRKFLRVSLFLLVLVLAVTPVARAQQTVPEGPVYVVQPGDSLWGIAALFGISVDELAAANGISDPGLLTVGARLVIPGLEGIEGVLTAVDVPLGANLASLSARYDVPQDWLVRLNRITNPQQLAAGQPLLIPFQEGEDAPAPGGKVVVHAGESLLEVALRNGLSPWELLQQNNLSTPHQVLAGDVLRGGPAELADETAFPPQVALSLNTTAPVQGRTLEVRLDVPSGTTVSGSFTDRPLNFFPLPDGGMVALQGIYALQEPGVYPFSLEGTLPDGTPLRFEQGLVVRSGDYPYDPPLTVASQTTNIENNEAENARWAEIVAPVTPERYWEGRFQSPMPEYLSDCFPSQFGNRRSYNQSGYLFFHTGLDFCGQTGVEIYAPARGKVVFTGELVVRGNATVIDHGWGVYSAYAHQSEILVQEGEWVEAGQLIGRVGSTGRVTGPHLHWEIIVGGVQVDPLQWLAETFP
ncbi:MAG: LysM peptidoglycan-binding domain-containing protein [Anaerolineae bacterium]|nr:MAG: LysM peptidoglycan-binding domain-containing protein [Anaerolineae bacterium]